MRGFSRFLSACLVALAVLSQSPAQPLPPGEFLRRVNSYPTPELAATPATRELILPSANKIDSRLRRLLVAEPEDRAARSVAIGAGPQDARIPVVVQTISLVQVQPVESAIRVRNGEVNAAFENSVWARIPASSITAIATLAAVRSVRVQPEDRVEQGPESGDSTRAAALFADGIRAAHLQLLHQRGLSGKGVKIGILDLGFGGYTRLLHDGHVKAAVAEKSFPANYGVENSQMHGTACAEVIAAAAPAAEVYLASFDGRQGHMLEAAQWLLSQGVQIVSYSAGNTEAPNDGTDVISRFVDYTTRRYGVLWVVAAGNHAQKHWAGFSDTNRDGIIETTRDGMIGLEITALSDHLRIVVRWDDWGLDPRAPSATQDIDAILLAQRADGRGLYIVQQSTDPQNGGAALPVEVIDYAAPNLAGQQFTLRLKAKRVTRRLWVHVFVESEARLYPFVSAGSILNPASARLALAVGGIDILTNDLAKYSSQGPTDDNRLKPEVTAPTNTISWAYESGTGRFPGTSASCPHVAGFAALLKEMNPQLTASELRLLVMRAVSPRGSPQPNAFYGYGQIDASALPATPSRRGIANAPNSDGSLAVPVEFGGTVSLRTLAALRNLANEARDGLSARVVTGRDLYRIGDGMRLGFSASGDCTCLLFVRDAGGNYALLSPEQRYLVLHGGQPLLLPREESQTLEVTGPAGTDELLLVCATRPVNLNVALASKGGASVLAVSSHSYLIVGSNQ